MKKIAKQAIVIGASIAGLSAARALSSHFEKVLVIERDDNPNTTNPRKAVPQGHHAHALLKSGELALETLFPNIGDEIVDCGGKRIDFSKDIRWYHGGQWKMRYESHFEVMVQTRPLLEQMIRNRVKALGNVEFYLGYEVESILSNADKSQITGVVLQNMDNRAEKMELQADLLVDASGRGSKSPQWLESMGYAAPSETRLKIDLTYSSRLYQAPQGVNYDWKLLLMNPEAPAVLRAGYIFPIENNQWMITFGGYSGDATPKDNESFLEYAKGLAQPDIYEVMQELEPISDVKVYNIPQTVRRHYEKATMPKGFLVMGDAFCAFDPVFGQGMSAAAKEALALSELLEQDANLATLGKRFHKKAAQIVEAPWLLASSEDFRYPKTVGEKSPLIPFLHWYSGHVFSLSATDKEVFTAFRQVMHLLEGAEALFKPSIVLKVLKHAFAH